MTAVRTLVSIVRRIPAEAWDDYRAAWAPVRVAAEALGARAWHFAGVEDDGRIVEFLEWKGGDARTDDAVRAHLDALETRFAAEREEAWREISGPIASG